MFFRLTEISDHPCCKMQEMVEYFFRESIDETEFSAGLFPEWVRDTLANEKCTLDGEFKKVHEYLHAAGIDEARRTEIYELILVANRISELCEGTASLPEEVLDWNSPLGIAIKELMERLYDSLDLVVFRRAVGRVKARQEFYEEFIKANKYVCPFCGIGKYKNKRGKRREDFDHLLCKASYPLSAANMKNLVPTCGTCNQDYKKAKNVLEEGKVFYPYSDVPQMSVEVDCLVYPATDGSDTSGQWSVEVGLAEPNPMLDPKMLSWDRVYSVKQRLIDEVAEYFEEWMDELAGHDSENLDEVNLRNLIQEARDKASSAGLRRMKPNQIIRAAFYDFMLNRAEQTFLLSFQCRLNRGLTS